VNGKVPAGAIGVPEMMPVFGFRPRFSGSVPEAMLKVRGPVPPTVPTGWLYSAPIFPAGSEVVVIESGGLMVKLRDVSIVCGGIDESTRVNVCELVRTVVGVPVIAPVCVFNERPAGSAGVTDHK
jgi:hypothetical protein